MFNFSNKKPYRIGVAFSGGGARGFAHAGALKALAEFGVKPDIVAGVSAGSVAAVMHAAGMSPEEMLDAFAGMKLSDLGELSVPKNGFFSIEKLGKFVERSIGHTKIEELPLPAVVCATDMDNGCPVAFEKGNIGERVAASCAIPIIFKPVKIDGIRYIDGGVLHNLPAWALRDRCKYLIGLNCSSLPRKKYKDNLIDIATASFNLVIKSNIWQDTALCDITVEMDDIAQYKVFNLRETRRVFRQGYHATMQALLANGFDKHKR